jgi:hypothetical protein
MKGLPRPNAVGPFLFPPQAPLLFGVTLHAQHSTASDNFFTFISPSSSLVICNGIGRTVLLQDDFILSDITIIPRLSRAVNTP